MYLGRRLDRVAGWLPCLHHLRTMHVSIRQKMMLDFGGEQAVHTTHNLLYFVEN